MRIRVSAVMIAAGLLAAPATAQQSIEWKQTLNIPKGTNLPDGVSADILGIEIGDTYDVAKKKLEALAAETQQPKPSAELRESTGSALLDREQALQDMQNDIMSGVVSSGLGGDRPSPLQEIKKGINLPLPGGSYILADWIGQIRLTRDLDASGPKANSGDFVAVHFSAPSSGHQVIAIERTLSYGRQADQVRISEIVKSLSTKFQSEPRRMPTGNSYAEYRWQFNDGRPFASQSAYPLLLCPDSGANSYDSRKVHEINSTGECDVLLKVTFNYGISDDHASGIRFLLTDNERTKENHIADFAFFKDYVAALRAKTKGAAPKL